jgi:signal transduction histidine kinase
MTELPEARQGGWVSSWRLAGRAAAAIGGAPFSPQTWLATMQVLVGAPVAFITCTVTLFLGLVAVAVLPTIVLIPVPLVALLACTDLFTTWQRSRLAAFGGATIPATPRLAGGGILPADLLAAIRSGTGWRQVGYHLAVAPAIAAAGSTAVTVFWAGALLFVTTPLHRGRFVAALPFGQQAPKLVVIAATLGGLALVFAVPWVARGFALLEVAAGRAMVGPSRSEELSRHVTSLARSRAGAVSAADAERRRIERDLHDGTQQRLVSMAMNLGLARATLPDLPDEAREVIERAHDDAKQALRELRDLVQGLHPAILSDRGLDAALSGIAARAPLPVRVNVELREKLPSDVEAVAFFVVSEALTNVAKHAAALEAEVSVTGDDGLLRLTISDNGHGGADPGGAGLRGLAQRVASIDGRLRISSPPGGPTVISAELPLARPAGGTP